MGRSAQIIADLDRMRPEYEAARAQHRQAYTRYLDGGPWSEVEAANVRCGPVNSAVNAGVRALVDDGAPLPEWAVYRLVR